MATRTLAELALHTARIAALNRTALARMEQQHARLQALLARAEAAEQRSRAALAAYKRRRSALIVCPEERPADQKAA